MTRIAALLIVFALTGGPIANAVCLTRCHSQLAMENCDEDMAEPTMSSGGGACPALVADTPFIREDGRAIVDTPASTVVLPLVISSAAARLVCLQTECLALDGRRMSTIVLRL